LRWAEGKGFIVRGGRGVRFSGELPGKTLLMKIPRLLAVLMEGEEDDG